MSTYTIDLRDGRYLAFIVAVWCASVLVVNPIGDFPLLDDWGYGQTVVHLLETGEYKPWRGFPPMALITNVFWGALFCLPAGFSFTALRFSTLVAALVGLIGVYFLVRDLQQTRRVAVIVVALLGFNPLFYMLSHTFMTEVVFIALLVWAAIFFVRTLRSGSNCQLLVATVLALAATFSRQLALCLPVAFAATALLQSRGSLRSVLRALVPAGVCLAGYLAIYLLELSRQSIGEELVFRTLTDVQLLMKTVITNLLVAFVHLGLYLLPVLIIEMRNLWRENARRVITVAPIATVVVVLIVATNAHYGNQISLPMFGFDFVHRSGVGSTLLRDVFILNLDNLAQLPAGFWMAVTVLGWVGMTMLITALGIYAWELLSLHRSWGNLSNSYLIAIFALLTTGLYLLLLLPRPMFFDKYLIPIIPFMTIAMICLTKQPAWISSDVPKPQRMVSYALLIAFSAYAILGTRDFLTWNRVRWTAVRELMQDAHVGPEDIDGGFEFNGLYLYDPSMTGNRSDVSWWWVHRDTYQIAFGPVQGYAEIKKYTYQHWLPWHEQKIVVLRKL